ncbi:MAG TPA: hypothetical protein VMS76_00150, partial [Planctomycetota bacterium]|nr:hypothetical protein [Planctomycetota bacterium]
RTELPAWLWLAFPPLMLALAILCRAAGSEVFERWMRTETGVIELGTIAVLLVAIAAGGALALRRRPFPRPWMRPFVVIFTLGCLFFAGEEASWGQHVFKWSTPETWARANDQQETNLHNLTGIGALLDQLPRTLLTIAAGVAVAGPLVMRRRRLGKRERDLRWLLPTVVCLPSAALALLVGVPDKVYKLVHDVRSAPDWMDIRSGELKEYYLGLFLMIYVLSLRARLRKA